MESSSGADAVVLSWKDNKRTINCLRHLTAIRELRRIIVVDNESDGSLEKEIATAKLKRVIYLGQPTNLGFSAGVNIGLQKYLEGGERYALVINNDATPNSNSIQPLIEACCNNADRCIAAPVIRNPDGSIQSRGERFHPWNFGISPARSHEPDFLTWACVLIPRTVLDDVGLLDESFFMYWEDVEYGFRARSKGIRLQCIESVSVTHERSASHERASTKIDLFSALGVVRLARKRAWPWRLGAAFRISSRIAIRMAHRRSDAVYAVWVGTKLGLQTKTTGAAAVQEYL